MYSDDVLSMTPWVLLVFSLLFLVQMLIFVGDDNVWSFFERDFDALQFRGRFPTYDGQANDEKKKDN
jgi:hypothetical protein